MTGAKSWGSILSGSALGAVAAAAALGGWWLYLAAAAAGVLFSLLALAQPLNGLLGFILLAPEATPYAQLRMPSGVPDLTFPRFGVALVVGALLLQAVFGARKLPSIGNAERAMIAFTALVYVDLYVRSRSFESEALIVFDELVTPFLFYYAARVLFRSHADRRKFFYVMVLMGLVLAAHGMYQYATHGAIGGYERALALGPTDTGHVDKGRAAGPFVNSVEFGGAVSLALVWGLLLVLYHARGIHRLLLLAALAVLGAAAVLSLTRAVWLGLFLALATIAWLDRRYRRIIVLSLGGAAVVGVVAVSLAPLDPTRIEERALSSEPVYIRLVMYRASLSMFLAKPIFGFGRGESRFVQGRQEYLTPVAGIPAEYGNMAGPPHNVYLFTLLQWGLLGLGFYGAIFVVLIRRALELRRPSEGEGADPFSPVLANFFLAASVLYLTQALFADVTAFLFLTTIYFVGAGVVAGLNRGSPGSRTSDP